MSNTPSSVQFHFLTTTTLNDRSALKHFILKMFKNENRSLAALSIVFCSDDYLLSLNRQFLKHDYYTDILSFPLSTPKEALTAEIYISIDRVRDNAKNMGATLKEETLRVIFHGVLHFCGYRDKTKAEILQMRSLENKYLKLYKRRNA